MKLRFAVDQAEAFRQGIDAPNSTVTVDVNPAKVPKDIRELVAERMDGIEVRKLALDCKSYIMKGGESVSIGLTGKKRLGSALLKAKLPTFEALVEAVKENEAEMEDTRQRSIEYEATQAALAAKSA